MELHGALAFGNRTLSAMIIRSTEYELQAVRREPGLRLHLIRLWPEQDPGFWDFGHGAALIAAGRRLAGQYLAGQLALATCQFQPIPLTLSV